MNRKYSHGGISLSGLIYTSIIFGIVAITVMKLFPLYNEKTKVDFTLEKIASQKESEKMTKTEIVRLIMRQFEVSEVRRWSTAEFAKVLKIEKLKGGRGKVIKLNYEIRGPFFGELDVVLKYDKALKLGEPVTD